MCPQWIHKCTCGYCHINSTTLQIFLCWRAFCEFSTEFSTSTTYICRLLSDTKVYWSIVADAVNWFYQNLRIAVLKFTETKWYINLFYKKNKKYKNADRPEAAQCCHSCRWKSVKKKNNRFNSRANKLSACREALVAKQPISMKLGRCVKEIKVRKCINSTGLSDRFTFCVGSIFIPVKRQTTATFKITLRHRARVWSMT